MNCKNNIKTQYLGELPVDDLESMVDFFLTERDVLDEATGNTIRSLTRTPSGKLFPNANTDNVFALEPNNTAIEIPENEVRAVYIANEGSLNVMRYADATHPATMLAVGESAGMILCMCCGAANIPESHQYVVGLQYYRGANGEPVTDPTSGQKLFIPVSNTKLVINL